MSRHRRGELGGTPWCRTGRFFYIHHKWYFACREGENRGPFDSKSEAQAALARHIAACRNREVSDAEDLSPSPG